MSIRKLKRQVKSSRTVRRRHQIVKRKQEGIVVRAPDRKPWLLVPEEVSILKNAVCKGASDEELKYCLAVARRYELDPFQQQIWFVPRWDSKATNSEGQQGATIYVPVVGINGLLNIAARDHKDFGTYSEPEYGPMMTVNFVSYGKPGKFEAPEWCRIEAWKKGAAHATVAKVWWNEIYPDVDKAPLVRRMPRLMLAKCAKAQATRTSYPKTGGLLIPEETHTREFTDITPGGRIVHEVIEEVPRGTLNAAQLAVAAATTREKKESIDKGKPIDVVPQIDGTIEVSYPGGDTQLIHVRGTAVAQIIPFLQNECLGAWLDGAHAWAITGTHGAILEEFCSQRGIKFSVAKVSGTLTPPAANPATDAKPESAKSSGAGASSSTPTPAPTAGRIIIDTNETITSTQKIPVLRVNWGGSWYTCFSKSLWEFLAAGKGLEADLILDDKKKIQGIRRIGTRTFDEDGKTPCISMSEDRPKTTGELFRR